jgi:hypothetical protein
MLRGEITVLRAAVGELRFLNDATSATNEC